MTLEDHVYEEATEEQEEVAVVGGLPNMAVGDAALPESESLFDQLRKKREEAIENKETFIPIPGYDTQPPPIIVAKYRVLDTNEIDQIGQKVRQETSNRLDRQMLAAIDMMIAACEGMYYDMLEGEGPQPLTLNGLPIMGYTQDLAQALHFEASTAREVVLGLFANNEVAVMQHNVRIGLWMGNTSRKVDQDTFLGEL